MKRKLIYIILAIVVVVFWEYSAQNNSTVRLLISSPTFVADYFSSNYNMLLLATYTTFIEALTGLTIATLFSFLMMIICFSQPKFMEFVMPIMITSQVIPLIVLAPFFIILFGIGMTSKIAMAAVISFFPVFINFAQGYKSISQNIHELMAIYQAPLFFRIFRVYFPLSMPSILAGLKVSATLSVIGAIVAEFSGAEIGLGKNLFISAIRLEPDLMMTSLLLSSIIGLFLYFAIKRIEALFVKWL
jgi:NitT/TauT family transport system permease protein